MLSDTTINSVELLSYPCKSDLSNTEAGRQEVVSVRNAQKCFGSKRNPLVVLDGLNMTIHKRTIYGLLGASGSGKTTLLRCILALEKLHFGTVQVFGEPPGTKCSGVPGPRVRYMPQKTALYGDLTISENCTYVGWILGMNNKQIQEKFDMLAKLLLLPQTNQRVKTLSGGELRRISLASVLLNTPELLILDEPTVGLDPLLRENVWNYLNYTCESDNTTIILTTHYIEEVRQAHTVGLMRHGQLLAEEPPEQLITRYECQSLEEVFLKLSVIQNSSHPKTKTTTTNESLAATAASGGSADLIHYTHGPDISASPVTFAVSDYLLSLNGNHMKALIWKNVLWWARNTGALAIAFVLSVFIVALFCVCVGPQPHDLPIAVVNYETNNTSNCSQTLTCNATYLSCSYLERLKKYSLILIYYRSEEEANESVLRGETFASIIVQHNYSAALNTRINDWITSKPWDIKSSEIEVFRDISNSYIATYLKQLLYYSFQTFIREYAVNCGFEAKVLNAPIDWKTPIYGVKEPKFTDFVMPGALVMVTFALALALTSSLMLTERNEVGLERTFTMGITETELLVAHIACEFIVMVIQSILAIATAFFLFNVTQKGSFVLIIALSLLVGVCGMSLGLLISSVSESFLIVHMLGVGTLFCFVFMGGILWPTEGMHSYIKPICLILPLTLPAESLRSILQRNWDLSHQVVYTGFICVSIWTIIFLILGVIVLKFKIKLHV